MSFRRVRVLLEVHPTIVGGMERIMQDLVAHVDRDRFEPILLSMRAGKPLSLFRDLGVRTEVLHYRKRPKELVRLLGRMRIDVVQTNCFLFDLALAARAARVPHLWCMGAHSDLLLGGLGKRKRKLILEAILQLSCGVICPSEFVRSQFGKLEERRKVHVIYNGVDLKQIDLEAKRSALRSPHGRPRIGMIARIQPQKRQLDFIRAARKIMNKIPQARFYLFGGKDPDKEGREYAALLTQEVNRLGLQDSLSFRECLPRRFEEYSRMAVFVLPSVREGAGVALLEAMALGKPVVGARSGGIVEHVRENKTGFLVPPGRPQAIADAVVRILTDPPLARRLGLEGRRHVERRFNIEDSVRKYERLWRAANAAYAA